jgi:hypothetical protein
MMLPSSEYRQDQLASTNSPNPESILQLVIQHETCSGEMTRPELLEQYRRREIDPGLCG